MQLLKRDIERKRSVGTLTHSKIRHADFEPSVIESHSGNDMAIYASFGLPAHRQGVNTSFQSKLEVEIPRLGTVRTSVWSIIGRFVAMEG